MRLTPVQNHSSLCTNLLKHTNSLYKLGLGNLQVRSFKVFDRENYYVMRVIHNLWRIYKTLCVIDSMMISMIGMVIMVIAFRVIVLELPNC